MQAPIPLDRARAIPLMLAVTVIAACSDPADPRRALVTPPDTSSLRVALTTTGTDLDPDGYVLVVDSTTSRPVRINDTVDVGGLSLRTVHTLRLDGVAGNCVASGTWAGIGVQTGTSLPVAVTVSCVERSFPAALANTRLLFERDGQVYRTRVDGSGLVALATGVDPVWSADGQRIAFTQGTDVYVMDADGANVRRVTTWGLVPSLSPDGRRVAFYSTSVNEVEVVTLDGSHAPVFLPDYFGRSAWTPDGDSLTFEWALDTWATDPDGHGVSLVGWDGSNPRVLTHFAWADFPATGGLAWSPDGRRLALSGANGIALVNADGSGFTKIGGVRAFDPAWSPDGQAIAFDTGCFENDCSPSVFYVTADGTRTGLLIENARKPSWSK